jgi:hypothetical protein
MPTVVQTLMRASDFRAGLFKGMRKQEIIVDEDNWSIRVKGVSLGSVQGILEGSRAFEKDPETAPCVTIDWISETATDGRTNSSIDLASDRTRVNMTNGLTAVVPVDT